MKVTTPPSQDLMKIYLDYLYLSTPKDLDKHIAALAGTKTRAYALGLNGAVVTLNRSAALMTARGIKMLRGQ